MISGSSSVHARRWYFFETQCSRNFRLSTATSCWTMRAIGSSDAAILSNVPFLFSGFGPRKGGGFGGGLGRVMFDEPISGVAYYGGAVYLVVGRMLCRLWINQESLPTGSEKPCATESDVSSKPNEHNVSSVQRGLSPVTPPIPSNGSHSPGGAVSPPQGAVTPPQGAVPPHQPPSRPPKVGTPRKTRNCDCSGPR